MKKDFQVRMTNMCMITDPISQKVLVQKKRGEWSGLTFPGGHVEPFESLHDSVVREMKEETGLDVASIRLCGCIHWCNADNNARYLVFLYKTTTFEGELKGETEEGEVFWMDLSALKASSGLARGFDRYLTLFEEDTKNELFGLWAKPEDGINLVCL